ncbi:MAG: aldose 1-epimerase family protein [Ruminococcus sp.]|nr:aldose 1-epimerase family protein [Ruminococcus sp.]
MLTEKTLKNISFAADENGAELHSLKLGGEEFLWQCGDAWKRYAPVLFPFICSPGSGKYRADGREYAMPGNHGFARDSVFEKSGETETSVAYRLVSSDTTRQWYPYDFELTVEYALTESGVEVRHFVRNTGDKTMYFYLGGHPAFICDIEAGDSYVEYEKPETIVQPVPGGERTVLAGETKLPLTREQFRYDVIMKDAPASGAVTLHKPDGGYVKVSFPDSRCIAVWTGTDPAAQFICLEPWTSVPVYADDDAPDIEKKPHAVSLAAGGEYSYVFRIEIGKA